MSRDKELTRAGYLSKRRGRAWLVLFVVGLAIIGMGVVPGAVSATDSSGDASLDGTEKLTVTEDEYVEETAIEETFNLSDAHTTILGDATDSLGQGVTGVANVSDNETNDIVLGVPEAGVNETGAVHLFFDPVPDGTLEVADANLTLTGEAENDMAGYDVASADITDDGIDELLIGAPGTGPASGSLYVFFGSELQEHADGESTNISLADASATITGESPGDFFGQSITAFGNESMVTESVENNETTGETVESDETDSFIGVGAPGVDNQTGAAYVFDSIQAIETAEQTATNATVTFTGEETGDNAGFSVAAVENYTDDGDTVLAVGAPQHDAVGNDSGAVYVTNNITEEEGDSTLADAALTLEGQTAGDEAGWAVADAGDVNGDDRHDIIVGAPYSNMTGYNAGAAYVHFAESHQDGVLSLGDVDAILQADAPDDLAGWSVAGAFSLSCDEQYGAVLVGSPSNWQSPDAGQAAGTASLVHGSDLTVEPDERPVNVSLTDAQATFVGEFEQDRAGTSVAAPGDVTGNNDSDVLVGAPGYNESQGAVYVVEGECPVVDEPDEEPDEEPVDDAFFDVEIMEKNDPVEAGETLEVTVGVTNTGEEAGVQDIQLKIGGERIDVASGVELDSGESETVTLTWDTDPDDIGEHTVVVYSKDDRDKQQISVTEPPTDDAFFDVEITEKNDPVEAGETLDVTVDVTNTGDEAGTQPVYLKISGERVDTSEAIELEPGESETVTLNWETDASDVGDHWVKVYSKDDSDRQQISVTEPPVEDDFFDIEIVEKNDPVEAGETLNVTVDVTNIGDESGVQDVRLKIGGTYVDLAEDVELDPDESETLTLRWDTGAADVGDHVVKVLTEDAYDYQKITVEKEPPVGEAFFDVDIVEKNDPIEAGETLEVTTEITNTGDESATQNINLKIGGERIDMEEVSLEPNETETVTLTWETDEDDIGDHWVKVYSDDDKAKQQISVTEPDVEEAFFGIEDITKNDPINVNETLTVDAVISNNGNETGTQNVTLSITDADGEEIHTESQELMLDPAQNETVSFEWDTAGVEAGNYTATVSTDDDDFEQEFAIEDVEPDEALFDLIDITKNDPINVSETLTVDAVVSNSGDAAGTQNVTLSITDAEGEEIYTESQEVTLDPTQNETVNFEWDTAAAEAGNYTATVSTNDSDIEQGFAIDDVPVDPEEMVFEIDDITKNDPINVSETLTVDADISNTGEATGTQNVTLSITDVDGEEVHTESQELTLNATDNATVSFEWDSENVEAGTYTATVSTDDDTIAQEFDIEEEPLDPAAFELEFIDKNDPIDAGETLEVTVNVTNVGEQEGTETIELLDFDGSVVDSEDVTLGPGESTQITLTWETGEGDAGTGDITVRTADGAVSITQEVTVEEPDEPAFFEITDITKTDGGEIEVGETLMFEATIENTGGMQATQNVTLSILDGDTVIVSETFEVTLDAGESETVTLTWETETDDAGEYTASVDTAEDSGSQPVTVTEPPASTVTFFGCGNVELTGPDEEFPADVTLLIYNPGQNEVTEVDETLEAGERPGSPGGQLIGIDTPFGIFENPNFNFDELNCGDSQGQVEGVPGDPRDKIDIEENGDEETEENGDEETEENGDEETEENGDEETEENGENMNSSVPLLSL